MIKTFDNLTVKSKYSDNWYDGFTVNTDKNEVSFIQRDARREGQVARHYTVTLKEPHCDILIEAESIDGGRYEQFTRTQCLELCLQLLEEAKSDMRHYENVNNGGANNDKDNNDKGSLRNTLGSLRNTLGSLVNKAKEFSSKVFSRISNSELLFGKDCLYEDDVVRFKQQMKMNK